MPFLRAGFNARHVQVGIRAWTRQLAGGKFKAAELIRFKPSGDLAWLGIDRSFLAWGDQCVFGTRPEFELPREWQEGLPQTAYPTPERRPRAVKIILPYPVSANRYWRTFVPNGQRRPITLVSEEAKAYKEECGWLAKAAGVRVPFAGTVELHVRLVPENRVCMDLDNCLKVTVDALKGIVYEDDDQIYRIVAERADPDSTGKRLEIDIRPFAMPIALESLAS